VNVSSCVYKEVSQNSADDGVPDYTLNERPKGYYRSMYNTSIVNYMKQTSIQISVETRERLTHLKGSERETYDELLNALIDLVPSGDDEGGYTKEFKASLMRSLSDIRHGRTYSAEDVRKQLGLA